MTDTPTDYSKSDVVAVYNHVGQPLTWDDLINWLDQHRTNTEDLDQESLTAMNEDLQKARYDELDFPLDPKQIYELIHQYRDNIV